MTELEKLVQTWEKYKPIGTPHERIWNGFIDDAKAAIKREKQALSIANVVGQSEQILAWERWKIEKGNYPEYRTQEQMIKDYLSQ
jgi:hypothetical protein